MISIEEIYSLVVVESGIDPDYFLDEMKWYEVEACIKGLENKNKASWEQCRFISYMIAQVNNTKKLKLTDILSFTWDKEEEDDKNTIITNEDIERLKNKANQIIKKLNG